MNLNEIISVVSDVTGIDITANSRKRNIIYGRVIYYRIARDITSHSLSAIGEPLNKDHATVLWHLQNNFDVIKLYEPKYYNLYLVAKDIAYKKVIKQKKDIPMSIDERIEKHYLDVNEELLAEVNQLKEYIEALNLTLNNEKVANYIKRVPERNYPEFLDRLNNLTNYMAKQ
jgi:recombinational DNA repair protein RecR